MTHPSYVLCLSMTLVHFIGITDSQIASAERVFGRADFVHKWHDWRSWGDIDWDSDTVVLGDKGHEQPIQWSWQDHELY